MKPPFIYQPPQDNIEILHQDDDILVVNKPAGLLSVPGRLPEHKDSLISRIQEQWSTALIVHRLDMETSGVMIFALNKTTQSHLAYQFQNRKVEKVYMARIWGHPTKDTGCIEAPLICDWPNRPKQKIDHQHGRHAITNWEMLKKEEKTTLVKLKPITGRSHQLRVHMLYLNHPIVGDRLYGTGDALNYSKRLHLHSQSLSIIHPNKKQPVFFTTQASF